MMTTACDSLAQFTSWNALQPDACEQDAPPVRALRSLELPNGSPYGSHGRNTRFGPYELVRLVGTGGMAEVYEARRVGRHGVSTRVALKRLLPSMGRERTFVEMFVREAAILSRLCHPGLLQIHEFDRIGDQYYIAMELVDGCDLSELLNHAAWSDQVLPAGVVIEILEQSLEALHYAHRVLDEQGRPLDLIHRDLKPSNLLVSRAGQMRIADFGLAKAHGAFYQTCTNTQLKGTLRYMAPELVSLEATTQSADLYAMGVVLYEMLTLEPFIDPAASMTTMVRTISSRPLRELTKRLRGEAVVFEHVLELALARAPIHRYGSAGEMLDDVRALRSLVRADQDLRGWMTQQWEGILAYRQEEAA